ncbi:carbon starvation CstA family protein [Methanobrevibacter sp.]|uniref:carbon starvation CstA family protein n=1 Tax=Methanobrevibacter sp. TaxID=66852 RepID=UPI0025E2AD6C|nr:carbon starvation CstA family protein [Methanobrevibacter sp.]MBQ2961403.1 carbon starvation protein A [Methanobrevibacter sp.]
MISFFICLFALILSYVIYGHFLEHIVGVDETAETPAYRLNNGVDYVPMNKYKLLLIHFLNIAGLGPIFGAIQGALFGPAAFLWIVLGTIFVGGVHDFFSGVMSVRKDGFSMPAIISEYLGETVRKFIAFVIIVTGILVAAVFATGSADLLSNLTHVDTFIWLIVIFAYFLIATLFPVDKIIGKIYPIFGFLFLIMAIVLIVALLFNPNYTIPEFTTGGLYLTTKSIFPYLFVTIACGAISGFHSSQSPIVARCMENEKDMRLVFYGAMVVEGILALIWAAIAMSFFHGQPQLATIYGATPGVGVSEMAQTLVGPIGLIFAVIGVVICPITTGDTALRSARITIADEFKLNQKRFTSRLQIALPLFILSFLITFVDFTLIWRYFAWAQLITAVAVLLSATVYLMDNRKHFIITFAPAILCTAIAIAYILQAPEGLGLDSNIANMISVIGTAIISGYFIYKCKK